MDYTPLIKFFKKLKEKKIEKFTFFVADLKKMEKNNSRKEFYEKLDNFLSETKDIDYFFIKNINKKNKEIIFKAIFLRLFSKKNEEEIKIDNLVLSLNSPFLNLFSDTKNLKDRDVPPKIKNLIIKCISIPPRFIKTLDFKLEKIIYLLKTTKNFALFKKMENFQNYNYAFSSTNNIEIELIPSLKREEIDTFENFSSKKDDYSDSFSFVIHEEKEFCLSIYHEYFKNVFKIKEVLNENNEITKLIYKKNENVEFVFNEKENGKKKSIQSIIFK